LAFVLNSDFRQHQFLVLPYRAKTHIGIKGKPKIMLHFCLRLLGWLSCLVADGYDGNGLQLEKNWANFVKFFPSFLLKLRKLIIVCSPFDRITRHFPLDVPGAFRVPKKIEIFLTSAQF